MVKQFKELSGGKKIIFFLMLAFLLFDISFTYYQNTTVPLDGDILKIVLPCESYTPVLKHPLGLHSFLTGESYDATNRFFAHFFMYAYFRNITLWLQQFMDPVESIYHSCALVKTLFQIILILVISFYITGSSTKKLFDIILAAFLITPLFQTFGYNMFMGIFSKNISVSVFYGCSLTLVVVFFSPFFAMYFHNKETKLTIVQWILLLLLIPVICLNGPLNSPVILLVLSLIFIAYIIKNNQLRKANYRGLRNWYTAYIQIPIAPKVFFMLTFIASIYSFLLGLNNAENPEIFPTLWERYGLLLQGFYRIFTTQMGPLLLLLFCAINIFILKKLNDKSKAQEFFKWVLVFCFLYIVLLPLGGYRKYRPLVLHIDTILPVFLGLIIGYGITTMQVLKSLDGRIKYLYYGLLGVFIYVYVNADLEIKKTNNCEQEALYALASSDSDIVALSCDCRFLSWEKVTVPEFSHEYAEMLNYWNVTDTLRLFYLE